ncbi:unnamed protein product [Blepharisma stoltei]|uniref:Uncharacterized protein n=1 Tax=Blepharisma stoltei TaxID=1481888 RepID=A0AAU9K595_9CILI|nr:unnamed protein product [Blepharisma stoltei]
MPIRSPRSSLETCNGASTENLILEQAQMLRRLEKQIQELQSQICYTQLESPKPKYQFARNSPKMVNSSTNTTIDKKSPSCRTLFHEKQSASTNTSFMHKDRPKRPPRMPRVPNLRFSTEGSESSETSPKSSFRALQHQQEIHILQTRHRIFLKIPPKLKQILVGIQILQ